jgi:DNA-binding transcriptional MerR regulator
VPSSVAVERLYTITELANDLAVTPRAIRFYESKGLIDPQRAGANRVYTHRDRARLLLILRGKRLGFSLSHIQRYLDLYDADPTHRQQLVHLLGAARQRIEELESQRRDLELTLEELREIEQQVLDAMGEAGMTPPPPARGGGRRRGAPAAAVGAPTEP